MVDFVIQAHPLRGHLATELLGCLDGVGRIVYDPCPDTSRSAWRTYRECLLSVSPHTSHQCILQEDVLICDGFVETVERIAALVPDRPVCLFVSGHPYRHAQAVQWAASAGQRWVELTAQTWIPVVATLWPQVLVEPMVAWIDAQFATVWPPGFTADDEICGRYLHHAGIVPLAAVPSLAEHPDTEMSLLRRQATGGMDPSRRAAVWIEDLGLCDARDLDWTAPPAG